MQQADQSQPLIAHLVELRNRLLRSVIFVLVVFCALVYWANDIYTLLATPLTSNLPAGATMIATNVATPFYCGVAFAYYVVFPIVFGFLTSTTPEGVQMATDISSYLDFVLTIFLAFGICFEVPVAIILLCWAGITTPEDLREKRPYIIVAAFIIGMLLTPPDIFSQTLLAVPMCLLFEVGVICAKFYKPREEETTSEENA